MVEAHGRMIVPQARNVIHSSGDENAQVGGGPSSVHQGGRYLHGICGDAPGKPQVSNKVGATQATYQAGQVVEFKVSVTAHHMGFFEFELCDDAGALSEQCFARHRLLKEDCQCSCQDGTNNCAACDACRRWWKPLMESEAKSWVARDYEGLVLPGHYLDEVEFTVRYAIPEGISTSQGVIRWHYLTTNSCTSKSSSPEEFWNCADVAISNVGASTGVASAIDNALLESMQPEDLRSEIDSGTLTGVYSACPLDSTGNLLGHGTPEDYLGACGDSNQLCVSTHGAALPSPTPTLSPQPAVTSAPSPAPTAAPTAAPSQAPTTPAPTGSPSGEAGNAACQDAFGGPCSGCLATNNVCYDEPKSWCDGWAAYVWCGTPALSQSGKAKVRRHAGLKVRRHAILGA